MRLDPTDVDGEQRWFQEEASELMTAVVFKLSIDGPAGHRPRPGGGRIMSPWNLALLGLTFVTQVQIRSRFV